MRMRGCWLLEKLFVRNEQLLSAGSCLHLLNEKRWAASAFSVPTFTYQPKRTTYGTQTTSHKTHTRTKNTSTDAVPALRLDPTQ